MDTNNRPHSTPSTLEGKQLLNLQKLLNVPKPSILSPLPLKVLSISKTSKRDDGIEWKNRTKSVVCIVQQDFNKFIINFCNLEKKKIIVSVDLSRTLEYKQIRANYHLIDFADDGMVGMDFVTVDDAQQFARMVEEKLQILNDLSNLDEKLNSTWIGIDSNNIYETITKQTAENEDTKIDLTPKIFHFIKNIKSAKNDQKTDPAVTDAPLVSTRVSKIVKDDIGNVSDFAHIHHLEFDSKKGYTYNFLDRDARYNIFKTKKDIFSGQNVEKLLEVVGVTASQDSLSGDESSIPSSVSGSTDKETDSSTNFIENCKEVKNSPEPNSELSKLLSELQKYQHKSFYFKDLDKADSLNEDKCPTISNVTETSQTSDSTRKIAATENDNSDLDSICQLKQNLTQKNIFAQIGVDAIKAFHERSNRSMKLKDVEKTDHINIEEEKAEKEGKKEGEISNENDETKKSTLTTNIQTNSLNVNETTTTKSDSIAANMNAFIVGSIPKQSIRPSEAQSYSSSAERRIGVKLPLPVPSPRTRISKLKQTIDPHSALNCEESTTKQTTDRKQPDCDRLEFDENIIQGTITCQEPQTRQSSSIDNILPQVNSKLPGSDFRENLI